MIRDYVVVFQFVSLVRIHNLMSFPEKFFCNSFVAETVLGSKIEHKMCRIKGERGCKLE